MKRILILAVLFLYACASVSFFGTKFDDLRLGMTQDQVRNLLGNPDGYDQVGTQEKFVYYHKMVSGWSENKADYTILFQEGKVIEYGLSNMVIYTVKSPIRTDINIHEGLYPP